jgi:hypothetical protein
MNFTANDKLVMERTIRDIMAGVSSFTDENGESHTYDVKDVLRNADLVPLTQETISRIMVDEIEPDSVIYDTLFTEIGVTRGGTFQFTSTGELVAGPVGEDGEYPETNFAFGIQGYRIMAQVQKYGLAVRIAQDVLEDNLIDVVGMWLRKARNALVRNREKMAWDEVKKYGTIEYNNAAPTTSPKVRTTTGRGIDGVQNGTLSLNDLLELYTQAMIDGYNLDTLIMHPFAWQMFMVDPEMKEIILNNNTVVTFRPPQGGLFTRMKVLEGPNGLGLTYGKGQGNPMMDPSTGKLFPDPFVRTMMALGAQMQIKPHVWPTPLTIIVSPFVPIKAVGNNYVTDMVFAEAGECGVVFRKDDPIVEQFDLAQKEQVMIRMKESFGMGVMNQGKAIRIAKNIVVDRNYVFQNMNAIQLNPLTRYSALSGAGANVYTGSANGVG